MHPTVSAFGKCESFGMLFPTIHFLFPKGDWIFTDRKTIQLTNFSQTFSVSSLAFFPKIHEMHRCLKEMLKKIIQNCPEIGIKFHSGSFITPAFALKNRLHMLIEHSSKGIAVGFCGVSSISGFGLNCEQKNGESDIQDAMMQIMQSPRKQRSRSLHGRR